MKQNSTNFQEERSTTTKSRVSDFWFFLIGLSLVIMSNYSDLNYTAQNAEAVVSEENIAENNEIISFDGFSMLIKETLKID